MYREREQAINAKCWKALCIKRGKRGILPLTQGKKHSAISVGKKGLHNKRGKSSNRCEALDSKAITAKGKNCVMKIQNLHKPK